MNFTYLLMSIPFLSLAIGTTTLAAWKFGLHIHSLVIPTAVLLATTAVFDNLIIGVGLVAYDESRILGLDNGLAPIADFLYAMAAVQLAASLWHILRRKESR
jgi:lycopene cyclase domain-containing protein